MSNFYTHREYLIQTLNEFNYNNVVNCLEFGVGDGSSMIFNQYANRFKNIKIDAFESDVDWLTNMGKKYQMVNYTFNKVKWAGFDYEKLKNKNYDLIFVDQGDWDARIKTLDELKNYSKYIIVHDYDYYNKGICEDIYSVGDRTFWNKYKVDFDMINKFDLLPPTLIMKSKNLR